MNQINKPVLNNFEELTPTERKIILAVRKLMKFDKLEIKFSEKNQLLIQFTRMERAVYIPFDEDNRIVV